MKRNYILSLFTIAGLVMTISCSSPKLEITPDEATSIGIDAYIFGYPLVSNEIDRRIHTNVSTPDGIYAPMGQFATMDHIPTPADNGIMAPDANSLYIGAYIDLGAEPYILSVPEMNKRFYLLTILDAWNNVIADPGTRTNKGTAKQYAITGPGWSGSLPEGIGQIKSPTRLVKIDGMIYSNGNPDDLNAVREIQKKFFLVPLEFYGKSYTPPAGKVNGSTDTKTIAREQVYSMSINDYFNLLSSLMKDNPPLPNDKPMLDKMAKIGLVPGKPFDMNKMDTATAGALSRITLPATKQILSSMGKLGIGENGWLFVPVTGNYDTNYMLRALVTETALGTYYPHDLVDPIAKVDSDKNPITGGYKYLIHFDKNELPPVDGFWSITMYDPKLSFVPNDRNIYSVCSLSNLAYNPDGSLDIYIQKDFPGTGMISNWLPAPEGRFFPMLRLYWPGERVINGNWKVPLVKKVD